MNKWLRYLSPALVASVALTLAGCAGNTQKQSTGEYIDSKAIGMKVKAALIDDPAIKSTEINVDTWKQIVQLNGFVDTADQKDRAEKIAQGVDGVRAVQNNLVVKAKVASSTGTPEASGSSSNPVTTGQAEANVSAHINTGTTTTTGTVPLDMLTSNADKLYGRTITVNGQVASKLSNSAFTVRPAGVSNDRNAVLVTGATLPDVKVGDTVTVTGTARQFDADQIRRDANTTLDTTLVNTWRSRPTITGATVEVTK